MAQRGGSVLSTVRFGEHVWSPVGAARRRRDRHRSCSRASAASTCWAAAGTLVCASTTRITPGSVLRREEDYPDDLAGAAALRGVRLLAVDAEGARARGGHRCAPSTWRCSAPPPPCSRSRQSSWRRGLEAAVPAKILDVNLRAFELGRAAVASQEVES